MYKNLCLIPAKAASTRLPLKNLLKINGKELIFFGINAALESGLFDGHIYVSTESPQIRTIAESYGAKVPYLRNEKLAKDPAGVADVALDFLEKFPDLQNFNNLFIILPTAPLIESSDIVKAFNIFTEAKPSCLMSVTETEHNALRSVHVRNNVLVPVAPESVTKKTQELESTYHINGTIIIVDIKTFLERRSYFINPISTFIMPRKKSIDIDTEDDYLYAKFLMEARVRS